MITTPCIYAKHVASTGYGTITVNGKRVLAHRLVMGFPNDDVGHVCHDEAAQRGECSGGTTCLHRRCINRDHLRVMTRSENLSASPLTKVARKFNTKCHVGHEFTPENTIVESKGNGYMGRKCRACTRERYLARKRGKIA